MPVRCSLEGVYPNYALHAMSSFVADISRFQEATLELEELNDQERIKRFRPNIYYAMKY